MANIVENKKFLWSEVAENHNKFWSVTLYDNDDVEVTFGRVGKTSQNTTHNGVGRRKFDKLISEKLKKGYKEIKTIDSNTTTGSSIVVQSNLHDIATKQIEHNSPQVAKLIKYLSDVNRHNIVSNTKLTYNTSNGLFSTPLGIVQPADITSARDLLNTLSDYVVKNDYKSKKFISSLEQYLTLIPQDIGMKFIPENILPDQNSVKKQNDILDSLEVSYQSVISGTKDNKIDTKSDQPKIFDVKMEAEEDKKVVDRIMKMYNNTKDRSHSCCGLKPIAFYSILLKEVDEAFRQDGAKMSNIWELFHGSSAGNLLSIFKKGLIIPPAGSAHVTGRNYSDGIYGSDISTKALNYSYGYWSGRSEQRYFMFLCDFAMGNYYVPPRSTSSKPPKGYDSYFAKGGQSGVQNNEMIVFRTSQVNLKYLIEFA